MALADAELEYRCPCLRMRAAWFQGLGLDVDDECVGCEIDGDDHCRFKAVAKRPSVDGP